MDPEIWAALILGGIGAISGGVSLYFSSKLEVRRSAGNARRAYVYEAKKRLYTECEPVLFQAHEMAQDARYRILNLADATRRGGLHDDGSGWLDREDYYFRTTIFLLLAPSTTFKLLQRRLTAIDLSLEPEIRRKYELLKQLWFSFAADWALAESAPKVPDYNPDLADLGQPNRDALLREDPATYWRQGLYRGTLDMVTEALIVPASRDSKERCQSLGEFWSAYDDPSSGIAAFKRELDALFSGFHPRRKPVLWRIFITQYMFCGVLLGEEFDKADVAKLDWRKNPSDASDELVWGSIRAAHSYVRSRVPAPVSLELPEEGR